MSRDDFKISVRIEEALFGAVGTSDCHKVGIMGGCGLECWVYQEGRCQEPDEMIERFESANDIENHERLYPRPKAIESDESAQAKPVAD